MSEFKHVPVLLDECIELLNVKKNGVYVDCTLGGGGHCEAILQLGARVIGIDRDQDAIDAAKQRLGMFESFTAVKSNYLDILQFLADLGVKKADGVIADLGVSSYQLDTAGRGFSYMEDGALDMRMDRSQKLDAYTVVNNYPVNELARIIGDYGEESWALRIAKFIAQAREKASIETTQQLVEIIKQAIPASARRSGPHPAKRTFQAIRIEVNKELELLQASVENMVEALDAGARLVVITFHSLEDRIVKRTFAKLQNPCTCPPRAPICVCNKKPVVSIVTRRAYVAGKDELENNPRSRSAKLRCVERRSNVLGGEI